MTSNQATPDLLASRLLVARPSLPLDRAPSLVAFLHGTVPLTGTPLLHLNPVKGAGVRQPFTPQGHIDAPFVEVGVYGRVADGRGREHARRLEHFVAAQVRCVALVVGRDGGQVGGSLRHLHAHNRLALSVSSHPVSSHKQTINHTQEGRKALCGQNFYEPSALDFWRGFPLYSLDEYRYLRSVLRLGLCDPIPARVGATYDSLCHPTRPPNQSQGEVRGRGALPRPALQGLRAVAGGRAPAAAAAGRGLGRGGAAPAVPRVAPAQAHGAAAVKGVVAGGRVV